MIRISQLKLSIEEPKEKLYEKAAKQLRIKRDDIETLQIVKKSLDARKKPQLFFIYTVDVKVMNEDKILSRIHDNNINKAVTTAYQFPNTMRNENMVSPVIVGMGPAGLFCGYMLAMHGYRPIILERGKQVEERTKDVEAFWEKGKLLANSNVQFGEGGAGTFSDGKLNTLVKDKFGRNRKVLEIFVENGAPEHILYESKPHIGTDILVTVVRNMREKIKEWGGQVRFESMVTDFLIENQTLRRIQINQEEWIDTSKLVLAIGHSARDTFYKLYERNIPMETKSFAVGLRVQHSQNFIDKSQYGREGGKELMPAAYKLTAKTSSGRGVYSFCMCPGGYVVNASSQKNRLAINGMSYSKRDSGVANSAIIVSVTPDDYPDQTPLGGIRFQEELEEKAYRLAEGKIPVQYYCDFTGKVKGGCKNQDSFEPKLKGDYQFADLHTLMKDELNQAFIEGMEHFDKVIPGYAADHCLLAGIESRTSSPVRISRDENLESLIKGLFPCGEGAGYAGGIMSAAMDGMVVAEQLARIS